MRGGEAPRAPEGRPRRGRGGSGPPVSPGLPPPVLLRLGSRVRGGGPGAWPAGGAGARGRPCRCRRGRSRPRPRTEPGRLVAGPAGDGREGPGPGVEEKEDIVSRTLQAPEVSRHRPVSLAGISCPRPSAAERCGRLHSAKPFS